MFTGWKRLEEMVSGMMLIGGIDFAFANWGHGVNQLMMEVTHYNLGRCVHNSVQFVPVLGCTTIPDGD